MAVPVAEVLKQAVPAADLPALEGKVAIPLALPTILNVAIVFTPGPRWELQANYLYIDDSVTSTLQISVLEATSPEVDDQSSIMAHADSHTYGLRVSRIFGAESRPAAKAGLFVEYEPNAIPDSTFSPVHMGFEKWEIGIGASVRLTNRLNLTLDYSHFILPERRVTDSLHRPLTNPALEAFNHPSPNGLYRAGADRIGVGIAFDI